MFSSPASIHVTLATSHVYEKAPSYDVLTALVRGKPVASFIGARPETRASALKNHIVSAFAPGHVLNYESKINDTMDILTKQLEMYCPVLDLLEWLRYFMIDTLSRIAFSEDVGFMIKSEDVDGCSRLVNLYHSAGADTTASSTSTFFGHTLRHPAKLSKLEEDLSTATLSQPPTFTEVNKLPYLEACVKESLWLEASPGDPIERVVGDSGAEIAGIWAPGGTVVAVSHHVVNRDESVWDLTQTCTILSVGLKRTRPSDE